MSDFTIIEAAAAAFVDAVRQKAGVPEVTTKEELLVWCAAFVSGMQEADSDYTLALDSDTEWLQEAYELGRAFGQTHDDDGA